MIDYIKGSIEELTPTMVVLDNHGIGYSIEISLQTYASLENLKETKVYIYHHIQNNSDVEMLYGFFSKDERALFELLISVSGVGVNTARVILSSFTADEFRSVILSENVNAIKSVKGIGLKTAQRMILELKDKIAKGEGFASTMLSADNNNNGAIEEAAAALLMLGFSKQNINKALQQITSSGTTGRVEDLIKSALQIL